MGLVMSWRPLLPREHGAWAMFIIPLLLGLGAARAFDWQVGLFAAAAFGFFLVRYPLMLAVKSRAVQTRQSALRWSALYGLVTAVAAVFLLLASRLWLLIPIGLFGALSLLLYLWRAAHRAEMTTLGEWTGIAGLTLGAPGAYLVATHTLDATALTLYLLNLLYFGGTVLYIRYKVREQPRIRQALNWRARLWAARVILLYHVLAIALAVLLVLQNWLPALALLALALPSAQVVQGVSAAPTRVNMRRLGLIQFGFTMSFALVLLIAYH